MTAVPFWFCATAATPRAVTPASAASAGFAAINLRSPGKTLVSNLAVNLTNDAAILTTNLPKLLPNNKYAASNLGQ